MQPGYPHEQVQNSVRNIHPKQAWLSEPGPKMILKNIQIEKELEKLDIKGVSRRKRKKIV